MFTSEKEEILFYRKLHQKMNAVIYVINLDPYIIEWITDNHMVKKVLGLTREEVLKQGEFIVTKLLSNPDYQESVELAVEKFNENPDMQWTGVYRIRNEDHSYKWITYTTATLEKNEKGMPIKAVCVAFESGNMYNTPLTLDAYLTDVKSKRYSHLKSSFTKRQLEILEEIYNNKTAKEIAALLKISVHTVRDHKAQLYKKLGCSNTKELYALIKNYEFFS